MMLYSEGCIQMTVNYSKCCDMLQESKIVYAVWSDKQ